MSDDDQSIDEDVSEDDIFERMPTKQERIGKLAVGIAAYAHHGAGPQRVLIMFLCVYDVSMRQHPLTCLPTAFCRRSQF